MWKGKPTGRGGDIQYLSIERNMCLSCISLWYTDLMIIPPNVKLL